MGQRWRQDQQQKQQEQQEQAPTVVIAGPAQQQLLHLWNASAHVFLLSSA